MKLNHCIVLLCVVTISIFGICDAWLFRGHHKSKERHHQPLQQSVDSKWQQSHPGHHHHGVEHYFKKLFRSKPIKYLVADTLKIPRPQPIYPSQYTGNNYQRDMKPTFTQNNDNEQMAEQPIETEQPIESESESTNTDETGIKDAQPVNVEDSFAGTGGSDE